MGSMTSKPWLLFVLLLILSYYTACFSLAGDTLSAGQSLSASDTLLSQGGMFELGFFSPGSSLKIYLGIWYKNFDEKNPVWVANRENPLSDQSSVSLNLSENGILLLFGSSSNIPFLLTYSTFSGSNLTEAVLGNDGNFVLRDRSNKSTIFWESFDHPTDTWLPGAKLGIDKVTGKQKQLISWKTKEDPAPGVYSFWLDPNGSNQYFLEQSRSQIYWRTGVWNEKTQTFANPELTSNVLFFNYSIVSNENETYFTYYFFDPSFRSKFVMESTGKIQLLAWLSGPLKWKLFWSQPGPQSDVYGLCGTFGVYSDNVSSPCKCLKGFEPLSTNYTSPSDWTGGCVRKFPLQCKNNRYANGKKDWFVKIPFLRLPVNSKAYLAASARNCEVACMNNCSCTAYVYNSSGYCAIWERDLLNLQQLSDGGEILYLRLAANERQSTKGKKWKVWVALLVPTTGLILCLFICFSTKGKLKLVGEKASSNNLLLFDFDTKLDAINEEMNTNNNLKKKEKDFELPLFSYESVSIATNNFSAINKLGEGGYGPVYKGKLHRGQEVAVKMLSKGSRQGNEEFKNETILIAKLQHRNLVRILGCCIERDEKILIYEYMSNQSLDVYLSDPIKNKMLAWETRVHIIEGIAQGLLYLHQYSRLRIIHRDLKPSNILLDSEMNPKISDFGMARVVGGNDTKANTNRIVGTYGYMSPEYAIDGLYSIKSDVFSFGVLLLEIISGKKNTGFYNSSSLNLLRYAWELWVDDRSLELINPTIGYPSSSSLPLRFINIGLLCVEESPTDRPTMLDVVSMIRNEHVPLLKPKQPAFTIGRNMMDTNPTIDTAGNCSNNNVTISTLEAR
ncbi:G-type lectin S-receptor-like serine/threonine-protein kinase At4g27290 [Alnus glutinosa]|uniref:G-type lectin S-receptor-like serine/threonine-protein kinase At4g27290 n=1 Tax=Alnus glutinosa TaxID=3517 RepID=UPI002D7901BF|nr:G-type lectin S-receptor-like serine/threonine-protein kinase At4g27290 [Alnus glutinosa]